MNTVRARFLFLFLVAGCGPGAPAQDPPARLSIDEAEAELAQRDALRPLPKSEGTSPYRPPAEALLTVSARLLDSTAVPLLGELAWIRFGEGGVPETVQAANSDRSGAVWLALTDLPQEGPLWLAAGARGTMRALLAVEPVRYKKRGILSLNEVTLPPGGVLRGSVSDEDGRPVAGAFVGLGPMLESLSGEATERARRALVWPLLEDLGLGAVPPLARTEADGRFEITGAPLGRCMLVAAAPAGTLRLPDRENVVIAADSAGEVRPLVLRASVQAQRVAGRVLAPDGTPLASAHVVLERDGEVLIGSSAQSGPDGRFALLAPAEETFHARALDAEGRFGEARVAGVRAGDSEVELRCGSAAAR